MPEQDEADNQPSSDSEFFPQPTPVESDSLSDIPEPFQDESDDPAEGQPSYPDESAILTDVDPPFQDELAQPFQVESGDPADGDQPVRDESTVPGDFDQPVTADHTAQVLIPAHTAQPADPSLQPELQPGSDTEGEPAAPPVPVKELRRLARADREAYDRQRRRFTACSRCGYLIADCQIYLGEEALQDALLAARDGWVRMEGDHTFHKLVMNAYGVQLDAQFDSLDGTCPECRRRYVLANHPEGPTRFKIRV